MRTYKRIKADLQIFSDFGIVMCHEGKDEDAVAETSVSAASSRNKKKLDNERIAR
jgi:hypothetical protein